MGVPSLAAGCLVEVPAEAAGRLVSNLLKTVQVSGLEKLLITDLQQTSSLSLFWLFLWETLIYRTQRSLTFLRDNHHSLLRACFT